MEAKSYVVAKFDFETKDENAFSFSTGDLIIVLDQPEGEWWLGQRNNKKGFFPHSYASPLPGNPNDWAVVVGKLNFHSKDVVVPEGRAHELLYFDIGELVVVLHKGGEGEEWWIGCNGKKVGYLNKRMVEVGVERETERKCIEGMFPAPKGGGVEGKPIVLRVHLQLLGDNRSKAMKFNQSMTVKETIQTIQDKLKIKNEPNKKYGLFLCPPVGIWCNEDLPLRVYELEGFSEVEFLDLAKRDELMNDISTGLYARVVCDFVASDSNMALSVTKGTTVQVLDPVSDEWWECRIVEPPTAGGSPSRPTFSQSAQSFHHQLHLPNPQQKQQRLKQEIAIQQGFVPRQFLGLLPPPPSPTPAPQTSESKAPGTVICRTSDDLLELIPKLLSNDGKVRGVSLSRCSLNGEMVDNLSAALEGNSMVSLLDLSYQGVASQVDLPVLLQGIGQKLKSLDLSYCSLTTTALEKGGSTSWLTLVEALEHLSLQHNHLSSLPSSLGNLIRLKTLDISFNKLEAVPEQLHMLKNLEKLNLSHNKLTLLPSFILSLKNLKSFLVSRNPLKGFPKEVVERGDKDVLAYMANMLGGTRRVYRMKLMIVGQENVGKTSVMKALKRKTEKKRLEGVREAGGLGGGEGERNVATDGIDIGEWVVKSSLLGGEERVEFSSWDFAGQDVYYSTHHLFLSKRAVYVVVFNVMDFVSSKVDYWVQSVLLRAPKAPVLFVATHIDERGAEDKFITCAKYLQRRYSKKTNIVAIHACSPRTGANIGDLIQVLVETALKQPYMPEDVPLRYCDLQSKILSLRNVNKFPTITWNKFCEMASDSKIEEESFPSVASYLNDLGVIAYFPEVDSELVVIDPQWITKMFATIVTTGGQAQFVKNGLLRASDFQQLWKAHPPVLHAYMLSLLEKFEVIHRIDEADNENYFVQELKTAQKFHQNAKKRISVGLPKKEGVNSSKVLTRSTSEIAPFSDDYIPSFPCPSPSPSPSISPATSPAMVSPISSPSSAPLRAPSSLCSIFVPCLLDEHPEPSLLATYWPPYGADEVIYGRLYKFEFLFRGFFPLLTVRFLRSNNWIASFYWQRGIILKDKRPLSDVRARLVLSDELQLTLYVRGNGDNIEPLRSILDMINELISEWLKKRAEVFVPCIRCLRGGGRKLPLIPLADCEAAASANRPFIVCAGGSHTIEVKDIAPDITLVGVTIPQLNYGELELGKELGVGGGGVVYQARYYGEALGEEWGGQDGEGIQVAFKKFQSLTLEGLNEEDKAYRKAMYLEFQHEVRVSGSLQHPRLVQLLGLVTEPVFGTVIEFMEGGDLFSYLQKNKRLTWSLRLGFALDIAEGMRFLHDLKLIHRDLKSPNILLTSGCHRSEAKVADFGLTKEEDVVGGGGGGGGVANPTWLAPEMMGGGGQRCTLKVDVYGFGVVMWEILTGENFFGDCQFSYQIEDLVKAGERPFVPEVKEVFQPYVDVLEEAWSQDPWERPSFAQICKRLKLAYYEAEQTQVLSLTDVGEMLQSKQPPPPEQLVQLVQLAPPPPPLVTSSSPLSPTLSPLSAPILSPPASPVMEKRGKEKDKEKDKDKEIGKKIRRRVCTIPKTVKTKKTTKPPSDPTLSLSSPPPFSLSSSSTSCSTPCSASLPKYPPSFSSSLPASELPLPFCFSSPASPSTPLPQPSDRLSQMAASIPPPLTSPITTTLSPMQSLPAPLPSPLPSASPFPGVFVNSDGGK